jgi:hypothetical protein
MHEAIAFHLDGLREDGQPIPEPQTYSAYVELPPETKTPPSPEAFLFPNFTFSIFGFLS